MRGKLSLFTTPGRRRRRRWRRRGCLIITCKRTT